jgi:hypothetical protein
MAAPEFWSLTFDVVGSESQFSYGGGAGVDIPLGDRAALWIEGRLLATKDLKMTPIMVGASIAVGD